MTPIAHPRRLADDGRWGILLAAGALALLAVVCVDALVFSDVTNRLVVVVLAVAVITELAADARTGLGVAMIAWPLANGFLQHHEGALRWDTATDFPLTVGLLGAFAVGMCVADTRIALRGGRGHRGRGHPLRKHQDSTQPTTTVPTVKV